MIYADVSPEDNCFTSGSMESESEEERRADIYSQCPRQLPLDFGAASDCFRGYSQSVRGINIGTSFLRTQTSLTMILQDSPALPSFS
jgi:hypothetical protein